jgi:signal transduction histidine kinase
MARLQALPTLSIRARLTIWYGVVLAITLTVFGLFVYATLERNLDEEVNNALENRAREVNTAIIAFQFPLRDQRIILPNVDAFAEAGTFVQIVDFVGQVKASSGNLGTQRLPFDDRTLALTRTRHAYFETVTVGRERLRIFNAPLLFGDESVGLLQVARAMGPVDATLSQLRLLMLGGGLASIVLSGVIGFALARTALRPIDRLTYTARLIGEAQDFARRVEHAGPADEVGRLAATFNEMLGRLHEAYGRVEASLAAQRRFVGDASHELRTPLTTIRGNAALLRRFPNMEPADREEALQQISGEAERMSRLVTDLLTLARADAGLHIQRKAVALQPVVEDVYRQLQLLANGRVLELGVLEDGTVRGDPDYLKQLLLILADNALKYTPEGGRVTLSLNRAGKWLDMCVADTGVGIDPADIPHIFDRFYRADHVRGSGGTGLGLAIARWIVDELGGRITVSSQPGQGSVFTVRLRLASVATPQHVAL